MVSYYYYEHECVRCHSVGLVVGLKIVFLVTFMREINKTQKSVNK